MNPYGLDNANSNMDQYGLPMTGSSKQAPASVLEEIETKKDLTDSDGDSVRSSEIEKSKKLSISQKIFKLRYLCKSHL